MEINDLFAASVRPVSLTRIMKAPKVYSNITIGRTKGGFEVGFGHKGRSPLVATNEADLWHQVAGIAEEDVVQLLGRSDFVTHRACARRAQMMTSDSGLVPALEEKVQERIATIQAVLIDSIGASRITRAKPYARPSAPSKNVSYWTISSNIQVPYIDEVVYMTTKLLPSVLDPQAWTMSVTMDAPTNEALDKNQRGIELACARLADQGIVIKDTVSGTPLAYL